MQNAAMLWTGGKDSAMALYEAGQYGCHVSCLVTFAPPQPRFLAHPLGFIKLQAEALGLPHYVWPIDPPFEQGYEAGLRRLRDEKGIECVVTGDIAEVGGKPNWIHERSRSVGLGAYTPLWGRDRSALLRQLLDRRFRARLSCVKTAVLGESWVGRELDDSTIADLQAIRNKTGLDLCGEEGEYHTLVLDGPQFRRGIDIRSYSIRALDSWTYMDVHELELVDHAA